MKPRYRTAPVVTLDLVETWAAVAERFGEPVADRVFEDLIAAFELLAAQPGIGHLREDLAPPPWHFWSVGPSIIAYRPDLRPIWIARIARAERDWESLDLDEPDSRE